MENHPIPQDVTNFQFKLIGNMTIKQFVYLAVGALLGWLFFILPITSFVTYPLAFLAACFGFSLAFIPVEGRPFDIMVGNFIRALFASNQYIFQKKGRQLLHIQPLPHANAVQTKTTSPTISQEELHLLLRRSSHIPFNKLDQRETVFFQSLAELFVSQAPTPQPTPTAVSLPQPENETTPEDNEKQEAESLQEQTITDAQTKEALEKEALAIRMQLQAVKAQEELRQEKTQGAETKHKALDLENQLQETLSQKDKIEQELLSLKKQLEQQKQAVFTPTQAKPAQETQYVKRLSQALSKSTGLPIVSDFPNLIVGIIKDARENILPNILVEVKDKEGNPVRAFKSNALGQFASATSLPNNTYTIEFEDPRGEHTFDAIELETTGEIIEPFEVISHDQREDLRKALFG